MSSASTGVSTAEPARSAVQLVVALLPAAAFAAVLVWRMIAGDAAWACALGLVGVAAWVVRALLRPRLDRAARPGSDPSAHRLDVGLLLVMLVPGALGSIPGDAAPIASAAASIVMVIGRRLLPLAWQFAWVAAAAVLAAIGGFVGPFGPWAAGSVALTLFLVVMVGVARRQGAIRTEEAHDVERAQHREEVAAARGFTLDPGAVRDRFPQLSIREAEVLGLVARGRSNAEIAHDLFLSVATVKSHVNALFAKLPARDRAHAIAIAYGTALPG